MSTPSASERIRPDEREGLPRSWTFEARGSTERWAFPEKVRPWNWVELDEPDARALWDLLGTFVDFFNRRYVERSEQTIPPCWPEHGCLVEEITTLFFARWQAFSSEHGSIGGAQYWHQYSVPGFVERMGRWLGADRLERCQQGLHEDATDIEPATEPQWLSRRHSIINADCEERQRVSAAQRADGEDRANPAPQIPFLEKQFHRETDGGESADG